jgi:hypothetical protein
MSIPRPLGSQQKERKSKTCFVGEFRNDCVDLRPQMLGTPAIERRDLCSLPFNPVACDYINQWNIRELTL